MDYTALDHLCLFAEQTNPRLKQELLNNGIIDQNGNPDINLINIRTGTFTSEIVHRLNDEQYDIQLVYNHLSRIFKNSEIQATYYFLYSLIKALDMEMPPMFIEVCAIPNAMQSYLDEFLADYMDCMKDYLDNFHCE